MIVMTNRRLGLGLALPLAAILMAAPVSAQQAPWATDPGRPTAPPKAPNKAAAPPTAPAARPAPKDAKEETAPARPVGEAQLRVRVEQLEEQLADMQVTIGTLESLGKTPAGGGGGPVVRAGAPAPGGGVDQARIDSLETQIRALTAQVEQLSEQLRQVNNRRGEAPALAPPPSRESALPTPRPDAGGFRQPGGLPPADPARAPGPGFGAVTVTPPGGVERDPIGRILEPETKVPGAPATPLPPTAAQAGTPKELYETAYGYLLQQDYGAAEVAFEEFLRRYPSDRLTPDAQYWLGETLYVQRRFKPAGQAFLRVVEKHQASNKVPNSLLKLALSLEQLGEKDCGLITELETRHPNAPADVKTKARALKQRIGC